MQDQGDVISVRSAEYVLYSDIYCEDTRHALVLNILMRMIIMLITSTIYTPTLVEKEKWLLV